MQCNQEPCKQPTTKPRQKNRKLLVMLQDRSAGVSRSALWRSAVLRSALRRSAALWAGGKSCCLADSCCAGPAGSCGRAERHARARSAVYASCFSVLVLCAPLPGQPANEKWAKPCHKAPQAAISENPRAPACLRLRLSVRAQFRLRVCLPFCLFAWGCFWKPAVGLRM